MKYRKRPIEIEAIQFEYTPEGIERMKAFLGDKLGGYSKLGSINKGEAEILTLEDGKYLKVTHIATEGDYIIKGIEGEFYPCKPDIFLKTYEKVDD